jgi:hypothetical protein
MSEREREKESEVVVVKKKGKQIGYTNTRCAYI